MTANTAEVERWLLDLESSMRRTLKKILARAFISYSKMSRENWAFSWPSQIVLATNQIVFTQIISKILASKDAKDAPSSPVLSASLSSAAPGQNELSFVRGKLNEQLTDLISLVRGKLTDLQRQVVHSLILLESHNRDVLQQLIQSRISSVHDFEWLNQLRFYFEDDACIARISSATLSYGYEYIGCTPRLVLTPLTMRCYRTLASAVCLQLGGAPTGPAGTGKTETVKDLAKSLAKLCVVFNSNSTLDYTALSKLFKGLASTGAWGCFDEFNRINVGVLSVIAQQIQTIQQAIAKKLPEFSFDGETSISLDPTCAIFITMNPGYAGRTELPDNLKALFRPVSMVVPDHQCICEMLLFAEGFQQPQLLASKLVSCFRQCSEQLTQQNHYDFGMRAIKTVLSIAGLMKQHTQPSHSRSSGPNALAPLRDSSAALMGNLSASMNEEIILFKALREYNLGKLVDEDRPIFQSLLADLFPGFNVPPPEYAPLDTAIARALEEMGLVPVPQLVQKCLQLYDALCSRNGIIMVGEPFSGKTTTYQALAGALNALAAQQEIGQLSSGPSQLGSGSGAGHKKSALAGTHWKRVNVTTINPKAITMEQLFGEMTPSMEWDDGILPRVIRAVNEGLQEQQQRMASLVNSTSYNNLAAMAQGSGTATASSTVPPSPRPLPGQLPSALASSSSLFPSAGKPLTPNKDKEVPTPSEHEAGPSFILHPDELHWVVFDGPIDPHWAESLNTALDDNKLLCLNNGERIPIPPGVR